MNISRSSESSNNYRSFIDDKGSKAAVTLNVSINGTAFDLVYNAQDEAFDGSPSQKALGIVNFAEHYNCGYALLLGTDCWVSANSGISLQAQIESNEQIIYQYDLLVLPLDDSIYIAELSDGFVTREKVQPVEQAIEFLNEYEGSKAILAGGKMSRVLDNENYPVNCEGDVFISGDDALPFTFQPLNWLLLKNKFYHHRLLVPFSMALAVVALVIVILIKLQGNQPEPEPELVPQLEVQPLISEIPKVEVAPKLTVFSSNLKNSAGQLLQSLLPRLADANLDFFKTCRLKQITVSNTHVVFSGEKMDNTNVQYMGCGYDRLRQVTNALSFDLSIEDYNWEAKADLAIEEAQPTSRTDFVTTMKRLQLLSDYIHWQFNVVETNHEGEEQEVRIILSGDNLKIQALEAITEVFMSLSAKFDNASFNFSADHLQLVDASMEFTLFTGTEVDL